MTELIITTEITENKLVKTHVATYLPFSIIDLGQIFSLRRSKGCTLDEERNEVDILLQNGSPEIGGNMGLKECALPKDIFRKVYKKEKWELLSKYIYGMLINKMIKKLALLLIRLYQLCLSPFFGPCCRFAPTCSEYAQEAIEKYGLFRAVALTLKRMIKCGPWHPGGYDPIP